MYNLKERIDYFNTKLFGCFANLKSNCSRHKKYQKPNSLSNMLELIPRGTCILQNLLWLFNNDIPQNQGTFEFKVPHLLPCNTNVLIQPVQLSHIHHYWRSSTLALTEDCNKKWSLLVIKESFYSKEKKNCSRESIPVE